MKTDSMNSAPKVGGSAGLAPVLVVPDDTPEKIIDAALAAGYIPVPCKMPGYVQLLVGSSRWSGDDLLMSALEAIQGQTSTHERSELVRILWDRIKARDGANDQTLPTP